MRVWLRCAPLSRTVGISSNMCPAPIPHPDVFPNAADCHIHIYDPRFPAWPERAPVKNASVADYRHVQHRLGTSRVVVVQPAAYGTDNRATMDALAQVGLERSRGVGVVRTDVAESELREMHEAGIRGLRFTQHDPRTAVTTAGMIEPLARRIQVYGWHTQLHLRGDQIAAMAAMMARLPGTVVIDHMARLPQPGGIAHPAFAVMQRLLDTGRFWVKLSGPYLDARAGAPRYPQIAPIASAYVAHAPERCVWGSDWPHPTECDIKPDDAELFDLLQDWAPDRNVREKILVRNPAVLYGFGL